MAVATVAQDRTVKLPVTDTSGAVDGADANAEGQAAFGDLLAQLTANAETGSEADSDEGVAVEVDTTDAQMLDVVATLEVAAPVAATPDATSPASLQALLANAVSSIVQDVKADVKSAVTAAQTSSNDLVALARAIADNAKGAQGDGVAMPSDTETQTMPSAAATLEAWANGPHTAAAPTTGAQEKRPMDLAVVGVATHFAPVVDNTTETPKTKADAIIVPESIKREASAVKPDVALPAQTVAAPTGNGGGAQSGAGFGAEQEPGRDTRAKEADVAIDVKSPDPVKIEFTPASQPSQPGVVVKQIAGEVMRVAQPQQAASVNIVDSKPGLSKLKVLHIQLQPDSLGSVTVRMELRADALELHIDAARADTAELIKRDREMLSSILRAAGYTADDAQIKVTHADPTITASLPTSSDNSTGSQQAGSQLPQDRFAQGERDGARRDRNDQRGEPSSRDEAVPQRGEAAGLYL